SDDEWYKAAYHKNDGVTANYWDYATGSNTIPVSVESGTQDGTAVFDLVPGVPAAVSEAGGLSPYGTRGQNGKAWEWMESAFDNINNSDREERTIRGGWANNPESTLRSSRRDGVSATLGTTAFGFRV